MELFTIATGSTGNAYRLTAGEESLLLDAGIPPKPLAEGLGYSTKGLLGALITHEHQDHARGLPQLDKLGIPAYATVGTLAACGLDKNPLFIPIKAYEKFRIGHFVICPFPAQHDAVDPVGFLILHTITGERMLYATDTYYLPHTFPGVNYWLIECNYMDDLLGYADPAFINRLFRSHMSLSRLKQVFEANDLTSCRQIILCHLSHQRGDAETMRQTVQTATNRPVAIATPGELIPLRIDPF